jgi:hypothetical protein
LKPSLHSGHTVHHFFSLRDFFLSPNLENQENYKKALWMLNNPIPTDYNTRSLVIYQEKN